MPTRSCCAKRNQEIKRTHTGGTIENKAQEQETVYKNLRGFCPHRTANIMLLDNLDIRSLGNLELVATDAL